MVHHIGLQEAEEHADSSPDATTSTYTSLARHIADNTVITSRDATVRNQARQARAAQQQHAAQLDEVAGRTNDLAAARQRVRVAQGEVQALTAQVANAQELLHHASELTAPQIGMCALLHRRAGPLRI